MFHLKYELNKCCKYCYAGNKVNTKRIVHITQLLIVPPYFVVYYDTETLRILSKPLTMAMFNMLYE